SEKPRGPVQINDLVNDLLGLMNNQGIDRALIVGCAIGGTVALAFAAAHPERAQAVLALAPATGLPPERAEATQANARNLILRGQRPTIDERLIRSWPE